MNREQLELYFIMGSVNVSGGSPLYVLEQALRAGVTMFQWREKGAGALQGTAYEQFASDCQQLCRAFHVPFIVNDDVDLALKLGADGVHIGQEDEEIGRVRAKIGNRILGVSVHSMPELEDAIAHGADYVGIGPIFETKSKDDANAPAGTEFLREARRAFPNLPIVAIGGITTDNYREPIEAGADGVAVISAICSSEQIEHTVRLFRRRDSLL